MSFYLRILRYGRGYERQVLLAILCLVLYNLFSATSFSLTIPFLEILFSEQVPQVAAPQHALDRPIQCLLDTPQGRSAALREDRICHANLGGMMLWAKPPCLVALRPTERPIRRPP